MIAASAFARAIDCFGFELFPHRQEIFAGVFALHRDTEK